MTLEYENEVGKPIDQLVPPIERQLTLLHQDILSRPEIIGMFPESSDSLKYWAYAFKISSPDEFRSALSKTKEQIVTLNRHSFTPELSTAMLLSATGMTYKKVETYFPKATAIRIAFRNDVYPWIFKDEENSVVTKSSKGKRTETVRLVRGIYPLSVDLCAADVDQIPFCDDYLSLEKIRFLYKYANGSPNERRELARRHNITRDRMYLWITRKRIDFNFSTTDSLLEKVKKIPAFIIEFVEQNNPK